MNKSDVADVGPKIHVIVFHGPVQYDAFVPVQSSFGELKKLISDQTNLRPKEQRLFFRGKEKDDDDQLLASGVKNNSKVVLLEDLGTSQKNEISNPFEDVAGAGSEVDNLTERVWAIEAAEGDGTHVAERESELSPEMLKAYEAIAKVRTEVDKLEERVSVLEVAVESGTEVSEKEFIMSTELLMRQLLNLDGIVAEGEVRLQRKSEVRRIQKLVDSLDSLKARNSKPLIPGNSVTGTSQWESFDSGNEGLISSPPTMQVSQDWERFQ